MVPRRVKTVFLLALMFLIMMLIYSSHVKQTQPRDTRTLGDFYKKTKNALDGKGRSGAAQPVVDAASGKAKGQIPVDKDADGDVDEDDAKLAKEMAGRLKAAEQQAKDLANAKSPNKPDPPSNVVGVGSAAGGQKKGAGAGGQGEEEDATDEVTVELNSILKKSPVVIFSKSYCPYSKKAKGVLLEKYYIDPAPFVVELDQHPIGTKLQARLGELTGRTTVPNVMIAGKSIGGGDDIAELDNRKTLIDKVKSIAGKRVAMKERFVEDAAS